MSERFDIVFVNGPVLTGQGGSGLLPNGVLAVRDGRVAYVGAYTPGAALPGNARETIDLRGNLLMPGLVNAHTHAATTIFRGLAEGLPPVPSLPEFISLVKKTPPLDWAYWGAKLACLEMIGSGTTTFGTMDVSAAAVARAAAESGMRAVVGEMLCDAPSTNYGPPENGLACSGELIERWRGHDRVRIAVAPQAPCTCSPELLRQCQAMAAQYGVRLAIHLAETASEEQTITARYGCRPVAHLDRLGLLGPHLIAADAVHLNADEIGLLAAAGVNVVHNPESNMRLARGVAPVPELLACGVTVGLGTDGCAGSSSMDLFREMDSAAKLQKLVRNDPTVLPARRVVEMATAHGARALGLEAVTGSLAAGMSADLIVVDFQQPHLTPVYDYLSHLVYCARGADVLSTMVAGRWLMREREVTSIDAEEVYAHLRPIAEAIRQQVHLRG